MPLTGRDKSGPYSSSTPPGAINRAPTIGGAIYRSLANRSGSLTLTARVPAEVTRGSKLTQFMAHHILRNVDRHVRLAVMYAYRHSHHLWKDRRSARPGFDYPAVAAPYHAQHFLSERFVNVWPFFP